MIKIAIVPDLSVGNPERPVKNFYFLLTLSLLFLFSCSTTGSGGDKTHQDALSVSSSSAAERSGSNLNAETKDLLKEESVKNQALEIISAMTLDEKIGQLFFLAMRHTSQGRPALRMDDYLQKYINRYKPGGIILFSINFEDPEQTRSLIQDLQTVSTYPLFISTDEEGGKVSRLGKVSTMNVVSLPPAAELARMGDEALVEKAASILAQDLKDLGFNMDMAPVADISRHRSPDIIGTRSFGSDPEQTGNLVASAVRGFQNNRIGSVLKHFPGHGYVTGDTHTGMVKAKGSKEEFETVDFIPFIKGIQAGADFIMTAHIQVPALTGNNEPASLSRTVQTELLRNTLNYKGIIITDAMDMGAISRYWSPGEAALKSFLAGTDIILMPSSIPEAQESLKNAYTKGIISEERLNSSLLRIISTKIRYGLFEESPVFIERISPETKAANHQDLRNALNLTMK